MRNEDILNPDEISRQALLDLDKKFFFIYLQTNMGDGRSLRQAIAHTVMHDPDIGPIAQWNLKLDRQTSQPL